MLRQVRCVDRLIGFSTTAGWLPRQSVYSFLAFLTRLFRFRLKSHMYMQNSLHQIIFWLTYFFAKTNQGHKYRLSLTRPAFYSKAKNGRCFNTTHTANCKLANILHIQPSGHFKTVFIKTTISVHIFLVLSVVLRPICNWDRATYSKEA